MRNTLWLLLACLASSTHAARITEPITAGTADIVPSSLFSTTGVETFSVSGADFSFSGSGNQLNQFYSCGPVARCGPGAQVNGQGGDIGTGTGVPISGNITFQGTSFDYAAAPQSSTVAWLTGFFNLSTPGPNFPPPQVTLTAPFHTSANFVDTNFHGDDVFDFDGQGTVTLNLVLAGNPEVGPFYALQMMHFDFVNVNVAEPSTGALIAALVAALGINRLRCGY